MNFPRRSLAFFVLCAALLPGRAHAADTELLGKVVVGYQGWFAPQGDGTDMGWYHYGVHHREFFPGSCTFDMWPDLEGFSTAEKFATPFHFADGRVAPVFSSASAKTVNRHFQWMRDYGIDAAALQRFGADLRSPKMRAWRDRVLDNCRKAAATNGRLWFVMYDLSGLKENELMDIVAADWKRLVDESDPRKDTTYTRHQGKPLVALWGLGFSDDRAYSVEACKKLVAFFKSDPRYGSNSVMEGVPYFWREGIRDSLPSEQVNSLYEMADVISPWSIGRYSTSGSAQQLGTKMIAPDVAWCQQRGIAYLPVFFPGFSWQNLEKSRGRAAELSAIPREGGKFLWTQAASALRAGARSAYIAMFDEIDEGTCIFKVTNNPPVGESKFATYEGLPSDHYLWLTGEIGRALRKPKAAIPDLPSR